MIEHKRINILFFGIFTVEVIVIILGFLIGTSFYFCLKPFIYVILAIFTYLFIDEKYVVKKLKKQVNQIAIMAIIAYMLLYILSGILFGFANNPLVMKGKFFFLNIIYYIPTLLSIEFIRYRILNFVGKEKRFKYTIIISLIFAFSMSNLSITMFHSWKNVIEMIYQLLVPNFVIGCFLGYIAVSGSLYASMIYVLIPTIYNLFARIIPNPEWIIIVILKTFIPFITYIILEGMKSDLEHNTKKTIKRKTIFSYFGVIFMITLILFACGIFRIYPVAIASNSMKPTFSRGDIQIIDKKDQVHHVGDIIQFYGLNDTIFVHRIVSVREEKGKFYYITKGDNNDSVDMMEIPQNRVIGRSILTIKYLGYPTVWLTEVF